MGHANVSATQKYLFVDETEMQNAVLARTLGPAKPRE